MQKLKFFIISFVLLCCLSCGKQALNETEDSNIEAFLTQNNIQQNPLENGIFVIIQSREIVPQFDVAIQSGNNVTLHYSAYYLENSNSYLFASTFETEPITIEVGKEEVIEGLDIALDYLHKNDVATLIVPSKYAYGEKQMGVIPPSSALVFLVQVIAVE